MNLTQIVVFGVLALGFGVVFIWANERANTQVRPYVGGQATGAAKAVSGVAERVNVRGWVMLVTSVVAIYWLQSSTSIRYLDFWLPTASLGLTLIVWAAVNSPRPADLRPTLMTAGVIAGIVMVIALTRYFDPACCITPSRPPILCWSSLDWS